MDRVTCPLTKPIVAHGETLAELKFREPTGKDIRLCGFPIKIGPGAGDSAGGFDEVPMSKMIATLAEIPPSSVDMLSMFDWAVAAGTVANFLSPPTPKSSTDTSTSPSSSGPT